MNDDTPGSGSSHDSRYYQYTSKSPLSLRISHLARARNFRHFSETMHPDERTEILDVGTCDELTPEANMLQQMHPYPERITCTSIGEGTAILAAYPNVRHKRIQPGAPLPFADAEFDIAFSNAVLEHVGTAVAQQAFVRELCRVSRRAYIAVPNRLFPIEHHTRIPLVHWLPKSWFRAVLRHTRFAFYARPENLNHVTASQLRGWFPAGRKPVIAYTGVGLACFRSNLVAFNP